MGGKLRTRLPLRAQDVLRVVAEADVGYLGTSTNTPRAVVQMLCSVYLEHLTPSREQSSWISMVDIDIFILLAQAALSSILA
jgi:hypothetical protein